VRTSLRNAILLSTVAAALSLTATPVLGGSSGASDETIAEAGVIRKSDVPRDFESTASASRSRQTDRVAATIPECATYLKVSKTNRKLPRAESRDYSRADDNLSNTSTVYRNTAKAAAAVSDMKVAGTSECLTQLFKTRYDQVLAADPKLGSQVKSTRVVIGPAGDLPVVGSDLVGYSGGIEIILDDDTVQRLLLSYLAVRVDRVIIGYTVSSLLTPSGVSPSFAETIDSVIAATVGRTEKALDERSKRD
jgi:hypothetical protein